MEIPLGELALSRDGLALALFLGADAEVNGYSQDPGSPGLKPSRRILLPVFAFGVMNGIDAVSAALRRIPTMRIFSITADNHVTAHATAAEAHHVTQAETFTDVKQLREFAAQWPGSRLVEIWNRLPGHKPVKKFTDRKAAVRRIWTALQRLVDDAAAQAAPVASNGDKSGLRATGQAEAATSHRTTKTAQALDLLKRPGGVTLQDLMAAPHWQAHSVRGFVSGTLGKTMGLTVTSTKRENGERVYSIR